MRQTTQLSQYIAKLARARDELNLQVHLFGAEAREQWQILEKDWSTLESELRNIRPEADEAIKLATDTLLPLTRKIEASLVRIREGLKRHHGGVITGN